MKEKNKKILVALLAVITIVGVVIYVGYRSHKKTVARRAHETEIKSQKEKIIRDFAKRYNALTDWNKDIHLTIQLQELLVNSDRHILFTGPIDDIFMKEGQYYIRFVTGGLWSRDFYQREIYFVLKCGPDKVLEVMDEMTKRGAESYFLRSFGDQYAVVAKVENVKKPVLQNKRLFET